VAGNTVIYTFTVTNIGNVTVKDITVMDEMIDVTNPVCELDPPGPLAPNDTVTCTADYIIKQSDVDAGEIVNSAIVAGNDFMDKDIDDDEDEIIIPLTGTAGIKLSKTASVASVSKPGEIRYTITALNTGTVTLTNVTITELGVNVAGVATLGACAPASVAPGKTLTCTATYMVTQADIDAGLDLTNRAAVVGTTPAKTLVNATAQVSTPVTAAPSIKLEKTAAYAPITAIKDTVVYTFTVTNTGDVTLDNVKVAELTFPAASLNMANCANLGDGLAPGKSVTCQATYEVTQADLDAGSIINEAQATATARNPGATKVSANGVATVTIQRDAKLSLTKSASVDTVYAKGDKVTYTFVVTNDGNVTVSNVEVQETGFKGAIWPKVTCENAPLTLAPSESGTCTADYIMTQADIDAGGALWNKAKAVGDAPGGTVTSIEATASIDIVQDAKITLKKTPSTPTVGEQTTVTYTFELTNIGTVTVTNPTVTEKLLLVGGKVGVAPSVTCPATASLAPSASLTCTAQYAVSLADFDAHGIIENFAQGSAKAPDGSDVIAPAAAQVTMSSEPAITITKTVVTDTGAAVVANAGETLTYTHTVTNTGNVTLTGLATLEMLRENLPTTTAAAPICAVDMLGPGESTTCTATHIVDQDDIELGVITHTTTATGVSAAQVAVNASADATIRVAQNAHLKLLKTAQLIEYALGETVTYHFLVINDGNMAVTGLTVTETDFSGSDDPNEWPVPVCTLRGVTPITPDMELSPGETMSCEAQWVITQEDIDSGHLDNTAVAGGVANTLTRAVKSIPDSVNLPEDFESRLELTKSGVLNQAGETPVPGDTITYTFTVTNTGARTVHGITVVDILIPSDQIVCEATKLAPTQSTTCTGIYTLTQADVDAGGVKNIAWPQGKDPDNEDVVSDPIEEDTDVEQVISMSMLKEADVDTVKVGEIIHYTYTVTNTGNTTITVIIVEDEDFFTGQGEPLDIHCPSTTLAGGAQMVCWADYVVVLNDLLAGVVMNTAWATGQDVDGNDVSTDEASSDPVWVTTSPRIHLAKSAEREINQSEKINYVFTITNTGDVPLRDIVLEELEFTGSGELPDMSALTCWMNGNAVDLGDVVLPVGGSIKCALPAYQSNLADAKATIVHNTAIVSATQLTLTRRVVFDPDPISSEPAEVFTTIKTPLTPLVTTGGTSVVSYNLVGLASASTLLAGITFAAFVQRRRKTT